ncbi:hypothetical protein GQ457_04G015540 [Hibiscus cannabinus]
MPRVPYSFWSTVLLSQRSYFFKSVFTCAYRYCTPHTGTHSCRSAFNAGLKLPNNSIDDINNQNGLKSVKRYKIKFQKLQQH